MGMNTLSINGSVLQGVWISTDLSFNKPERVAEMVSIPGRSGDLVIDYNKFSNVIITYPAYIREYFSAGFSVIVNQLGALKGYQRIECTSDPTHYRMGRVIIPQAPNAVRINKDGFFDLSFDCKPQRFLVEGDAVQTFETSGTITNPTRYEARPLIRIYGTGTVTVNGVGITLSSNPDYTDVDCEMQDCFYQASSRNQFVTFSGNDYPVLKTGANSISLGSGITKVEITPRWWEL